jgi:hypothetical protein
LPTTITTLGEWTYRGESETILAVACPISTRPEFNDGNDLQLFTEVGVVSIDLSLIPHLAALWVTA